ncbi:GNAT family N-acetyltransferase [Jannaschia sp. R86511]|uniref:GNAT family N-acetyltransferase n=1 Tax=Jannaschia sp. R86511 TaxID=3093853 RepID=UPI0036D30E99
MSSDEGPAPPVPGLRLARFAEPDAGELLVLQRCCWVQEAIANDTLDIAALHEDLDEVRCWARSWLTLVVRLDHRLVAAVRARAVGPVWEVGRLMVAPDLAGRGTGRWLLATVEALAPTGTTRVALFTGARSRRNLRMYATAGYVVDEQAQQSTAHVPGTVALVKTVDA